jgi:phenylalanyl-tRNA synthetase beta subunit
MPAQHGPWMKGRSSQIFINGEKVGEMGEINPEVGALFELRVPLHGAEFCLQALMKAIPDPVL